MRWIVFLAVPLAAACAQLPPPAPLVVQANCERCRFADWGTVNISARDATVARIIHEFRSQLLPEIKIDFAEQDWPLDYRVRQFMVHREPWRSAIAALGALVEAEVRDFSPTVVHLCRPTRVSTGPRTMPIELAVRHAAAVGGKQVLLDAAYVGVEVPIPKCPHLPLGPLLRELAYSLEGADAYQDRDGIWRVGRPSLQWMIDDLERRASSPSPAERVAMSYLIRRLNAADLKDRDEAETALVEMGMVAIHGIRPELHGATGERQARLQSAISRIWTPSK